MTTFNDSVKGFLDEVMPVFIGTKRSNGTVQMNPIWYERRGDEIWLNAAASRAWGRRLDPGDDVTLLFVDPTNQWRWAQVQAEVVDKSAEGGEEHIDVLARRYLGQDYAFHDSNDPRIVIRVRPTRVTGSVDEQAA